MFRNIEERKLMKIYREYADEVGSAVDEVIMQQIDTYRKADEAAEKDEDGKAAAFSLEEINAAITSSAVYPSAETVYFDEFLDEDVKKLKAIIATLVRLDLSDKETAKKQLMDSFGMSSAKAEKIIGKSMKQSVAKNLLKKARDIIVSSSDTIKH